MDLDRFEVLTFDCYGTLIDWETGILAATQPVLRSHGLDLTDDDLLERYARHEAAIEAGPYRPYREVLGAAFAALAAELGIDLNPEEQSELPSSVGYWPPFADSAEALRRLADRFQLGVITNCDDDLFAASATHLGANFDWTITAQQIGAYKPSPLPFVAALERIGGDPGRILHVAQSLYHDHVPARRFGLATAWVNRRHDRSGFGATPPAIAIPDLEVPDLATLAELATR